MSSSRFLHCAKYFMFLVSLSLSLSASVDVPL
nr:MAG TPA: hypothetical protein [Caudoviricetes sp.]